MGEHIAAPGTHGIICHVMQSDWSVTSFDVGTHAHIGPWLLCDSPEEVVKILTWGHISGLDLDEHYRNIKRWGVGGGNLHLSSRERHQLVARGHGWPWNGYELRKMKEAGCYPPQRLTLVQEIAYQRRHAAKAPRS